MVKIEIFGIPREDEKHLEKTISEYETNRVVKKMIQQLKIGNYTVLEKSMWNP